MKNDGEVNVRINTKADPKGIDETKKGLDGLLDRVKSAPGLFAKMGVAFAALTAALAAVRAGFAGVRSSIDEFTESEVRFRSWARSAANNGNFTQAFADQVDNLADKMERLTKISGEDWMGVFEELTKRGADSTNIEAFSTAVANLAALMGKDGSIDQAAKLFGQAMDGNYESLSRLGIEIDRTKSRAEQLQSILEQLAKRGAGILEERTKGLNGQIKDLKLGFDNLKETFGGFIVRTGMLQYSLYTTTKLFKFLRDLLPETKHKIDDIKNSSPDAAKALKEVGDAAAAGAGGLKEAKSAADELTTSYDKLAKAADEVRKQQDGLDDASTAAALAEIDFQVESGQLSKEEGRLARAGVRRDSAQRKTEREIASISTQERKLGSDRTMAEIEVYRADAAAKFTGGFRDALMQKAAKEFGLDDPNQLRDKKRFEDLTTGPGYWEKELERLTSHRGNLNRREYSNSILGIEKGMHTEGDLTRFEMQIREKMAEENAVRAQRAAEFKDLPHVIKEADAADEAAKAAREKLETVRAVANPKLQELGNRRTEIGFAQRTADLENRTELVRVSKERVASGNEGLGAEISKSTDLQQSNGNELLLVIRAQQQALTRLAKGIQDRDADNASMWREIEKLERWIRNNPNR